MNDIKPELRVHRQNSGSKMSDVKTYIHYPSEDEIDLIVLRDSPMTITDILRSKAIPVTSSSIQAIKLRLNFLEDEGKVKIRKLNRIWIIWHSFLEDAKKREIKKRAEAMGLVKEK